jgi:hypothetical protein
LYPERKNWINIPSGYVKIAMEKSPFSMGKSTISMVIFNSYVSHNQRVFKTSCCGLAGLVPQHLVLEPLQETKHDLRCGKAQDRNPVRGHRFSAV